MDDGEVRPLPCCYCGERPFVFSDDDGTHWRVACDNAKCRENPITRLFPTRKAAVRDWNMTFGKEPE